MSLGIKRQGRRTLLAIAGGCLLAVAAVWAVTVERISYERAEAVRDTERRNANLALAFEEHTVRTLKAIDQALRFLVHEYKERGRRLDLRELVDGGTIDFGVFSHIDILDDAGDSVFGPGRPNGADRPFFRHHRDSRSTELLINQPTIGRVTGTPVMHATRRVERPDGSFGGVILASVDPGYFSSFYQHIDVGEHGMIQLVGLDGVVRARRAGPRKSAGEDMRGSTLLVRVARAQAGNFVARGISDGQSRFMSYRIVRGYPLVVAVGIAVEEALGNFGKRARIYYLGASLATVLMLVFAVLTMAAICRRQKDLDALTQSEARYRAAFDQAAVGIAHIGLDGRLLKVNPKVCRLSGYSEAELLGRSIIGLTHPEDVQATEALVAAVLADAPGYSGEIEKRYRCKDGRTAWVLASLALVRDAQGRPEYFVGVAQDITERKEAQAKLERQAHYDALTGLPNRVLSRDRLAQAVAQAGRHGWSVGLLHFDLDRFKLVNDTFGHPAGDELLREAAGRVAGCVRTVDTVARVGGDEFSVVLAELADAADAALVAQKVIDAMARPYRIQGREIFLSASIGIATFPRDGRDGDTLVRNADAAMLRAKEQGRDNFQFYTAAMNERALEDLMLANDLRRALERHEFFLEYQPIAYLAGGGLAAFEALLRWRHPERGLVPPARFVPLLESSGLIVSVGEWVIRAACRQLAEWRRAGRSPVPVAVNLSARQLLHREICNIIERELRAAAVPPDLLEVEITESDAMANADQTAAILLELRARGVRVAIDDFGTGYSSLAYLKRFPVTTLKLDRSFVSGLPRDPDDVSIARAVVSMAHNLGLKVIAEGVERDDQRAFLALHGCDQMQGYLVARPQPAAEAARMLPAAGWHENRIAERHGTKTAVG